MTENLAKRDWIPEISEIRVREIARRVAGQESAAIAARIEELARDNRTIHEKHCFNLNPATNVMNPRAEALLASGLGTRPSLGYPGDKYEMGLEAIEEIEVICAELCAEVFGARYAEIRVPSGAIANLYGFMALSKPGDQIIVPAAKIGGHVTHHISGCAGLYGLSSVEAPVDADGYTLDLDGLAALAERVKPAIITVGGSLNLFEHPVRAVREIADRTGAWVLFDAAHQCGMIAGKAWRNPLDEGAHLMTMSTYKSLGGPPSGLIVTNEAEIAKRLDSIAFPGMTANFDAAKSAALAMTMLDWKDHGHAYASAMIETAQALAKALKDNDIPVFEGAGGVTRSHQFAVLAEGFGGGQAASKTLRKAGFLACGIGLPVAELPHDLNGLRIGTPELVRWGMGPSDMPELGARIAAALRANNPGEMAEEIARYRGLFNRIHYVHGR